MHPHTPPILLIGFIALPLGMLIGGVMLVHRHAGDARNTDAAFLAGLGFGALVCSAVLALTGFTHRFDAVPPPALPIFGVLFFVTLAVGLSRIGQRLSTLPLTLLVGFQAFRIVVELLIHQAILADIAPPQMGWASHNLDIITGVLAIPCGIWADRLPKAALWLFNLIGLGLLLNVVTVAILSMPTPFQVLTPDNTWVGYFPYIWLPAGLVTFALLGHVLLTRRLLRRD